MPTLPVFNRCRTAALLSLRPWGWSPGIDWTMADRSSIFLPISHLKAEVYKPVLDCGKKVPSPLGNYQSLALIIYRTVKKVPSLLGGYQSLGFTIYLPVTVTFTIPITVITVTVSLPSSVHVCTCMYVWQGWAQESIATVWVWRPRATLGGQFFPSAFKWVLGSGLHCRNPYPLLYLAHINFRKFWERKKKTCRYKPFAHVNSLIN